MASTTTRRTKLTVALCAPIALAAVAWAVFAPDGSEPAPDAHATVRPSGAAPEAVPPTVALRSPVPSPSPSISRGPNLRSKEADERESPYGQRVAKDYLHVPEPARDGDPGDIACWALRQMNSFDAKITTSQIDLIDKASPWLGTDYANETRELIKQHGPGDDFAMWKASSARVEVKCEAYYQSERPAGGPRAGGVATEVMMSFETLVLVPGENPWGTSVDYIARMRRTDAAGRITDDPAGVWSLVGLSLHGDGLE